MPDIDSRSAGASIAVADPPWRNIALFLLTASVVVLSLAFTKALLFSLVGAVALAVVTQPIAIWLQRRMSPTASAAVLVLAVVVALLLPLFFIGRDLLVELISFIHFVQSGSAEDLLNRIAQDHPKIGGIVRNAAQQTDLPGTARRAAASAARPVAMALSKAARGITRAVLLLFFYFFLVRDHRAAREALAGIVPLPPAETDDLLHQTGDVVQAIFAGRFLIAIVQGVLAGLAYLVLGVPGALLWSSITIVCCLIPAFGSFIAWVPIALYLGLAQSWTKAAILAAWGGIIVGNIDNVLYPALVGKRTDLHTAVIFVAIFGGLAIFGVSGFVLGPVIVAVAIFLLRIWKQRLQKPLPAGNA